MATPKPLLWQVGFWAVMVILFLCILHGEFDAPYGPLSSADYNAEHTCALSRSIAEELDLRAPVSYARLRIDIAESKWYHRADNDSARRELNVAMPPLRHLSVLDGDLIASEHETCSNQTTIKMHTPSNAPVDASNIVFGVATTLDRLEQSLLPFSHWAGHTGTRILSLIDSNSGSTGQIAKVLRDATDLGIDLHIARQNLSEYASEGDRNFALTKYLYKNQPDSQPQWAAFIDDDTFFPSMEALMQRLDQYDAALPQYIGGLAEDLHQLQNFGYMAYGGGGIFVSMPLLEQVNEHFDECNGTGFEGGDKRLAQCIYSHTTTKLSWESGLHQTDLHGDPSGFYEADRVQPLSIHHWKSWNDVDIVGLSAVSSICGTACLLQRYRFADGWNLVNGFSIFKYSDGYSAGNAAAMEETWSDGGNYMHSLAPLKPKDDGKVSYRLGRSLVDAGRVRQFYVKRSHDGDGVVEVEWRRRL